MRVYKCDKCGKIVENEKDITRVSISYFEKFEDFSLMKTTLNFEFCKSCGNIILDFLRMKQGKENV
jgi:ribosomal protein S26